MSLIQKDGFFFSSIEIDGSLRITKKEETFFLRQKEQVKRSQLETLARVQVVLRHLGHLLALESFPTPELLDDPIYSYFSRFFNQVLSLNEAEVLQVYVLKSIKGMAGISCLLNFISNHQKKNCSWMRCNEKVLFSNCEEGIFGALVSPNDRCDDLSNIQRAIGECLNQDTIDPSKCSSIAHMNRVTKFLLPALNIQLAKFSSSNSSSEKFFKLVRKMGELISTELKKKPLLTFLSHILPTALNISLLLNFPNKKSSLFSRDIVPVYHNSKSQLGERAKIFLQLQFRILMKVVQEPKSWIACLLTEPGQYIQRFLPATLFGNPLEGVKWYKCSNGHPYSVGECGKPMQIARCAHCNVEIGGSNHKNVPGVREAEGDQLIDVATQMGYQYTTGEVLKHISPITTSFIRLLVNLCLYTSLIIQNGSPKGVSTLLRHPNNTALRRFVVSIVDREYEHLISLTRFENHINGVFLNATLFLLADENIFWTSGDNLSSKKYVGPIESVSNPTTEYLASDISTTIQPLIDASWKNLQRETLLHQALGDLMWERVMELCLPSVSLWYYYPPVNIEHFKMEIASTPSFEDQYPLLSKFMEIEKRLELVGGIVAIFEWHRLLFSVLQNNEISREQAQDITNKDIIQRLPTKEDRDKGIQTLHNFCETFNQSFPIVDQIFECNQNPFLTENGEVDLTSSGKPSPMSPDTSIFFSLPNSASSGQTIAAQSYCTIQLLTYLHRIHQRTLDIGDAQHRNVSTTINPDPAFSVNDPNENAPVISCDTPILTLKQKLICYNRYHHLIPLLNNYCFLKKGKFVYDFASIQNYLKTGVFGGKQSIRLNIKRYQYQGDISASGGIYQINNRIPQQSVPQSIMQLIFIEVDTRARFVELISKLEIVISFINNIGGSSFTEMYLKKTLLRDYAVKTLQIPSKDWDQAVTPTINGQIKLCHLRSLFMNLHDKNKGYAHIPAKYKVALLPAEEDRLQASLDSDLHFFSDVFLPALHDFMDNQLSEDGNSSLDSELDFKELMEMKMDSDENSEKFLEIFPPGFKIQHSVALFSFLSSKTKV